MRRYVFVGRTINFASAQIPKNAPQILGRCKQKEGHSRKGGPFKWSKQKSVCGISVVKRKITAELAVIFLKLVDSKGIEPSTSAMRTQRSPS